MKIVEIQTTPVRASQHTVSTGGRAYLRQLAVPLARR